jgi:hypothetical protein
MTIIADNALMWLVTRATVTQSAVAGTGPALSPYNHQNVIFQGTRRCYALHHVGTYKDPAALSYDRGGTGDHAGWHYYRL